MVTKNAVLDRTVLDKVRRRSKRAAYLGRHALLLRVQRRLDMRVLRHVLRLRVVPTLSTAVEHDSLVCRLKIVVVYTLVERAHSSEKLINSIFFTKLI